TQYDYIIIDCPPIDIVADTQIIGRLTDMTIFVIRAGLLEKSDIHQIQDLYNDNRYPNMAVVLNGVDVKNSYYSNRYYGHKYAGYIKEE
ncbi:MAG: chromosome partitioning protein ParA, partial [Candidatus Amulumruptor sp.]